jgi:hypothetical protein
MMTKRNIWVSILTGLLVLAILAAGILAMGWLPGSKVAASTDTVSATKQQMAAILTAHKLLLDGRVFLYLPVLKK